jgi:hypothetical protein
MAKPKPKKHGVGLSKGTLWVDPKGKTKSNITVFVDNADKCNKIDAKVDSNTHWWNSDQKVTAIVPLKDKQTNPTITAAAIQIEAHCTGKKSTFRSDGDDDLIVTISYDDESGSGGLETDECTFTDVDYEDTSTFATKTKNDRPK